MSNSGIVTIVQIKLRQAKIKKTVITSFRKYVAVLELSYIACRNAKMVQPFWKTVWQFHKMLNIELPYDPEIPFLEYT